VALDQVKHPHRPCCAAELPVDRVDEALFTVATRVQIGNGETMKFWTSTWLNGMAPTAMLSDLYDHSHRKNMTVAAAIANG
jgi:hypothetical protein